MIWKTTNLQLQKGSIFLLHGDSAPIFRKICMGNKQPDNSFDGFDVCGQ